MQKVIEFKGVYYKYPYEIDYAIKDINVDFFEKEIVAIIGSNGAGKTTLIKHMNGLLKPVKGDVYVRGINTKNATVAELSKKVGIVFQNPDYQLFAQTVFDEISFALKNFGFKEDEIKERVKKIMNYFSISDYENNSPILLSGGEKKRVTIASVLVYDPEIIILDEPTIGFDYIQKKNLKKLILNFKEEGRTVIIVSHDLDFIVDIVDRIIVMHAGIILAQGNAEEILFNEEILSKANLIPPSIVRLVKGLGIKENIISFDDLLKALNKLLIKNV